MASGRITATGVPTTPGPDGSVPLRREIRDLQANFKDQWNLYLLGLVDFQAKPVTDLLSYYQLAGIHGQPFVPWNDVFGNPDANFGGYCTHSSILFVTWHRPYLALYEQALYASVQKVAARFQEPLRARYVAAAKDFRMPYWDWATRISGVTNAFPSLISSPSATVVDIDGATKQINNPLYTFRFNDKRIPSDLALDNYWSRIPNTKRSPDANGNSQNALVGRVITNEAASLRNNVSLILLSYKDFDAFSSNQWLRNGTRGTYGSVEDLHNEIHDKIGQGGHMGSLEVSSFDPVFWLHHTNVDRLWGIWQALNPNSFAISKVAQAREANYTIEAGTRVNASTELKPFYDKSGTKFWDSAGSKLTTPFGYTYPETQRWKYPTDQAYLTAVRNEVTRQYGGNVITNFFDNIASNSAATASVGKEPVVNFKKAEAKPVPAEQGILKTADVKPVSAESSAVKKADVNPVPVAQDAPKKESTKDFVKHALAHPFRTAQHALGHDSAKEPTLKAAGNPAPKPATASSAKPVENHPVPAPAPQAAAPHVHDKGHAQAPVDEVPTSVVPLNVPDKFAHLIPDRTYTEWITNLRAIKHGLSQTFRVYVFLGDFNPDPTTWPTEYNVVGRFTVLGRGGETQCEKCQTDTHDELVVTGTVPLTSALLQDIVEGQLASLKKEDVDPYLEKHLHWRVTVFDGSEKPREEVPGLKVSVVSTDVRIGDDGVPVYSGHYESHAHITDGRPAGLGQGDEI